MLLSFASGFPLAFGGHSAFLAHVPVPLGHLVDGHADRFGKLDLHLKRPVGIPLETLEQEELLLLILGHPLVRLPILHVDIVEILFHLAQVPFHALSFCLLRRGLSLMFRLLKAACHHLFWLARLSLVCVPDLFNRAR